jgi:hypothetical protein
MYPKGEARGSSLTKPAFRISEASTARLFVEDAGAVWSTGKQPTEITLPVAT